MSLTGNLASEFNAAVQVCQLSTMDLAVRILQFVEHVSDFGELYAYQRAVALRIIESLLLNDGETITVLFARQSGKSVVAATLALGLTIILPVLARCFPGDERLSRLSQVSIGIFGPNSDSTGPIYERIRASAESERVQGIIADPELNVYLVKSSSTMLLWNTGASIRSKTAGESAFVEGKTYNLVLIDEAQKVSATKVDKEISPMRAATNGTMVKIGTAFVSRGGFHKDIKENIASERLGGKRNHFEFDYEFIIREKQTVYDRQARDYVEFRRQADDHAAGSRLDPPDENLRNRPPDPTHLSYKRFVSTELKRLGGPNNQEFKMNFRLLWEESTGIALSDSEIKKAGNDRLDLHARHKLGIQVAGLDIAKTGDSSVLTIADIDLHIPSFDKVKDERLASAIPYYTKTVIALQEFQGSWERIQYPAIADFLSNFNVRLLCGDGTGIGDPVLEALELILEHIGVEVRSIKWNGQVKHNLYTNYLTEFRAGRYRYPRSAQAMETAEVTRFIEQHSSLAREFKNGLLTCYAATEQDHDDYPDSSALTCWAAKLMVEERNVKKDSAVQVTMGVGRFSVPSSARGLSAAAGSREGRYKGRRM